MNGKVLKKKNTGNQSSIIQFLKAPNSSTTIQSRKKLLSDRLNEEIQFSEENNIQKKSIENVEVILTDETKNEEHQCEYKQKLFEKELECEKLKTKISEANVVVRALHKTLNKTSRLVVLKDIKINDILQNKFDLNSRRYLFEDFSNTFNDKQLTELRSILPGKSGDATVVRLALQYLYEKNINILQNRTAVRYGLNKTPISPEKKNIIKEVLKERLSCEKISEQSRFDRQENVNSLIKTGIKNITNKKSQSSNYTITNNSNTSNINQSVQYSDFPLNLTIENTSNGSTPIV